MPVDYVWLNVQADHSQTTWIVGSVVLPKMNCSILKYKSLASDYMYLHYSVMFKRTEFYVLMKKEVLKADEFEKRSIKRGWTAGRSCTHKLSCEFLTFDPTWPWIFNAI